MAFWQHPLVPTALILAVLLGVGQLLGRRLPVPASIVGGGLGLLLGPGALGLLPLDTDVLEAGVYHALALVFICLGLQRPARGRAPGGARSMAFGISTIVALQTCVGRGVALSLGAHPGFGLLLPLGFEQGPGQAMSLGAAWEQAGLPDGAQVGLIIAAIGFGWAVFAGVPLVLIGRRRGWVSTDLEGGAPLTERASPASLTTQIATVGTVYAGTWVVCSGLAGLLSSMPDIAAMVWGFHFLVGAGLAGATRAIFDRLGVGDALDDAQLGGMSGGIVDLATVAALAAVQLAVLGAWWLPILAISTLGGVATLAACLWLATRGFEQTPFEHAVLWFGMSTGTLPVGLALLRAIDPELRSPAPASAVVGSGLSIAGVAPIVLVLHPLAIAGSPGLALGACCVWLGVLLGGWWAFGGLRLGRPDAAPAVT